MARRRSGPAKASDVFVAGARARSIAMLLLLLASALPLWAPACARSGFNPTAASVCDGVDCSGHGTCATIDGKPGCACDPGYHSSGALQCVADALPGDAAMADRGVPDARLDTGAPDLGRVDVVPVDSGAAEAGASDSRISDLAAEDSITLDAALSDLSLGDRPTADAVSSDVGGGTACALPSTCPSGFCVDGFCCNSACGGTCEACSLAKTGMTSGTCAPVTIYTNPDAECVGGSLCDGAGTCKLDLGQACGVNADCVSSNCPAQDNVCCENACAGSCESCLAMETGGTDGVCAFVTTGTDPEPDCGAGESCDGAGVCRKDLGVGCGADAECVSGNCPAQDAVCCDVACTGTCLACTAAKTGVADGVCSYVSAGTDLDDECVGGDCNGAGFCDAGGNPIGTVCANGTECASTFCTDGVCCDGLCDALCEACLGSYTGAGDGVCSLISVGLDPDSECAGTLVCDGNGACGLKPLGVPCGAGNECIDGNCVDGYCCNNACVGACDACSLTGTEGFCTVAADGQPGDPSCSPYLCNGVSATCPSSCSGDLDCVPGAFCDAKFTCAPDGSPLGAACSSPTECTSGFCPSPDGVCCDTACDADCHGCTASRTGGADGVCGFITASTDPDNDCPGPRTCLGNGVCE